MTVRVRDVMKTEVKTVEPGMPLAELERTLIERRVGGFPVMDGGKLVGVVSRSDIVRTLNVERAYDDQVSDHFDQLASNDGAQDRNDPSRAGARVGARLERLCVGDAMVKNVLTANPDQGVSEIAKLLVERRIHRLPVIEDDALVGIITSLDLVRLISEGRYRAA